MKDNTLRELTPKELIRKEISDFYINILGYCVEPEDEYTVELATDQLEALLAEEVRKAIEKIAQENTVNFFGIQEGSDISTKKKWVQVIKTQDILEQLEKEGK